VSSSVLEAGHYYAAHGPTQWSTDGWAILERIQGGHDSSMLFVDDVHPIGDVWVEERSMPVIYFDPAPDHIIRESEVVPEAAEYLDLLRGLSKKHRATRQDGKPWFCSGFPITDKNEQPLCVLLDAGLTLRKYKLGFRSGTNILPWYYRDEQCRLRRLVEKVLPDFSLHIVLFDQSGECFEI